MSFYNFYLPTVFSAFKKQKLAVENHFSRFHFIHSTFFDDWKLLIFAFKKQNYRKVENDHMSNETFWAIFKHCVTPSFFRCVPLMLFSICAGLIATSTFVRKKSTVIQSLIWFLYQGWHTCALSASIFLQYILKKLIRQIFEFSTFVVCTFKSKN